MSHDAITNWRDYRTCSKKQRLALDFLCKKGAFKHDESRDRILLYGGAGWGGKSHLQRTASLEIILTLRDMGFPDQWVTLFTSTYPNLEDRHIRKFEKEFAGLGEIKDSQVHGLHFRFFGEGLGGVYLRNIADSNGKKKGGGRRGAESVAALIDESTEFEYLSFTECLYTIRPDATAIPFIATLLTTNPDGIGHGWNKKIFVPKYRDLDHQFFKAYSPKSLFFIPALKSDNPAYAMNKDIIDARMAMIEDEDIRAARDTGSWDLYASGRFPMWKDNVHFFTDDELLEELGIPSNLTIHDFILNCRSWGYAIAGSLDYATSSTSISSYQIHLICPKGLKVWTFDKLDMVGVELEDQADEILKFERKWLGQRAPDIRYCDPALLGKAAESKNKLPRIARFKNAGVRFKPGINDRVEGAGTVAFMLAFRKDPDTLKPISKPRWRVSKQRCKAIGDQISELPRDPNNPEDADPRNGSNHYYDSARYLLHTRFYRQGGEQNSDLNAPPMYSPEWFRLMAHIRGQDNTWAQLLS